MVNEVETILNEIRERVRAEEEQREARVVVATQNGNEPSPAIPPTAPATEALARLEAHLTTTSRAWDRLPPLFSNRSGMAARFELWIKARMKSLSRWFTWEQVNFNSAAHHGLSDALEALKAHAEQLIKLRAELNQTREALRAEFTQSTEALRAESRQTTESLRVETRQRAEALQAELAQATEILSEEKKHANEALATELRQTAASLRAELSHTTEDLRANIDARAAELNARVTEISDDLHEEQRVCFKQLSLETSEAAVLEDRGRRALEARVERLEKLRAEKES